MNMYSHGVDPGLDFSNMKRLRETYERLTRMHVYEQMCIRDRRLEKKF